MFTLTPETVGPYLPTLGLFVPNGNGSRNGSHFYFKRIIDAVAEYNCNTQWPLDLRRNSIVINGREYFIPNESIDDNQILQNFLAGISNNETIQTAIIPTHNQALFNPFAEFYKNKNSALSDLHRNSGMRIPLQTFACQETVIEINETHNNHQSTITWTVSTRLYKKTEIERDGIYVVSEAEEIGPASILLQLEPKKQKWEFVEMSIPYGFLGSITTNPATPLDIHQLERDIPNVYCHSYERLTTFAITENAKSVIPHKRAIDVQISDLKQMTQPTIIDGEKNKALILPACTSIEYLHISENLFAWRLWGYAAQPALLDLLSKLGWCNIQIMLLTQSHQINKWLEANKMTNNILLVYDENESKWYISGKKANDEFIENKEILTTLPLGEILKNKNIPQAKQIETTLLENATLYLGRTKYNTIIVTIEPIHFKFLDMAAILYLQNLYPERLFVIRPNNFPHCTLTPSRTGELPLSFSGDPSMLGDMCSRELLDWPVFVMTAAREVLSMKEMPQLSEQATFVNLIDRNGPVVEQAKGNPCERFGIRTWHVLSAPTVSFARQARVMSHCCAIGEELSTTTPQITGNTIEELLASIQAGAIEATRRIQSITLGKESDETFLSHNGDIIRLFSALQSQIIRIKFTGISDLIQYLKQLLEVAPAIPEEPNLQDTTIYYHTFLTKCLAAAQTLIPEPEPQPMVAAHQECCRAAVAAAASEKPYQVQKMEMPEPESYPAAPGRRQQITAEEFIGRLVFAAGINTAIITVCDEFHIVAIKGCGHPDILYCVGNAPAQSKEPKVTLACRIQFSERLALRTIDRLPNLDRNAELPEGLSLEQRNALDAAIKKHNPPSRRHHPGHWQSAQLPHASSLPQPPGQHHDRHHQASTGRGSSQPHTQDKSPSTNLLAYCHW